MYTFRDSTSLKVYLRKQLRTAEVKDTEILQYVTDSIHHHQSYAKTDPDTLTYCVVIFIR